MYTSLLSMWKYTFKVHQYIQSTKKTCSKYKNILSKYTVTFGTLARNYFGFPANRSEPIENRNFQNLAFATFWTRFRKLNPERVPGTRFLPGTAPARQEHTKIHRYMKLFVVETIVNDGCTYVVIDGTWIGMLKTDRVCSTILRSYTFLLVNLNNRNEIKVEVNNN